MRGEGACSHTRAQLQWKSLVLDLENRVDEGGGVVATHAHNRWGKLAHFAGEAKYPTGVCLFPKNFMTLKLQPIF